MPNKYPQQPQAELDLHQHTKNEAAAAVRLFLGESEQAGHQRVRIIVGRGIHSKEGPVLGDVVRALLRDEGYDFSDAKINQGAEGAIEVKL